MIEQNFSFNLFLYKEKAVKINNETEDRVKELFDLNRIEYKTENNSEDSRPYIKDEKLVKVWCSCGNFDNLSRFGFWVTHEDKTYKFKIDEYFPIRLFGDRREGESITIYMNLFPYASFEKAYDPENNNERIPFSKRIVTWYEEDEAPEFLFKFTVTFLQQKYKFKEMGDFQTALAWTLSSKN